jgi:hypothetical protein
MLLPRAAWLALVAVAPIASGLALPNLVTNPSFELGETGWAFLSEHCSMMGLTDAWAADGRFSLLLNGSGWYGTVCAAQQAFPAIPLQRYHASVVANAPAKGDIALSLTWLDGATNILGPAGILRVDRAPSPAGVSLLTLDVGAPARAVQVLVRVEAWNDGGLADLATFAPAP